MKGNKRRTKWILGSKPRAFCALPDTRLSLIVSDMADRCLEATSYSSLVQLIQNYFSVSTKCWQLITSQTSALGREENRVDALKLLRSHLNNIYTISSWRDVNLKNGPT